MFPMRVLLRTVFLLTGMTSARAQSPEIFDTTRVVVGSQRIETLYFYATGKWSDAGDHEGSLSAQILCYQKFGFCHLAQSQTLTVFGSTRSMVHLDSFDILRWDADEMIAVDSGPPCWADTMRVDFRAKTVSLSSAPKAVTKDNPICSQMKAPGPAFLLGTKSQRK